MPIILFSGGLSTCNYIVVRFCINEMHSEQIEDALRLERNSLNPRQETCFCSWLCFGSFVVTALYPTSGVHIMVLCLPRPDITIQAGYIRGNVNKKMQKHFKDHF